MKRAIKIAAFLGVFCCLSPSLDAQQLKPRRNKERLDRIHAKRKEKDQQQAREAYEQAKQVRGLAIRLSRLLTAGEEARYHAALGLAEIGPSAAHVAGTLASRLFDESPRVRVAVVEALCSIGPAAKEAVPDLVILLKDSDPLVRQRAASALGVLHSYPEIAVPALIKALDDPGKVGVLSVRWTAIMSLEKFGPAAKAAYPRLMKEYKGGEPSNKGYILNCLAATKANTPELLRLLIDIINDPAQEGWHASAAIAIGRVGPEAKSAIPQLLKLLECKNLKQPKLADAIQPSVLHALAKMGSAAKEAVPTIIAYAADPVLAHTPARHHAFVALGNLGPTAKEAIPFLIDCLTKAEYSICHNMIQRALNRMGKDAVKPLTNAFLTAPAEKKGALLRALGSVGAHADAREALPLLEAVTDDRSSRHSGFIWRSAQWAISAIKSKTPR